MSNIPLHFTPAKRESCKAAIVIEGLSGWGKTGLALIIAYTLADQNWNKTFLIDTESRSALLTEGTASNLQIPFGAFQHGDLSTDIGFAPSNYLAYRKLAVQQGALAVIQDSISHAWNYKGGVLDLVTQAKAGSARYAKDSYAAWGDETVVVAKNQLLELIRDSKVHVISTVRLKERFEYAADADGKSKLISLGDTQIQQADLKYEPDLVLHMLRPGENKAGHIVHPRVLVIKSRYDIFQKDAEYDITPTLLEQLRAYLAEGVDPAVLLEQQRLEWVEAVTLYLDEHPNARPIWTVLKADMGHGETKLSDLPLVILKAAYIKLTS